MIYQKKEILKNFNNTNQGPSTDINFKSTNKENIINDFPDDDDVNNSKNKKEKNVMFGKTLLETIKKNQPSKSNINNNSPLNSSHNDNQTIEDELKEVQLFPTNTIKTICISDNQSNQQSLDDNEGENVKNSNNYIELLRVETYKTLNLSVENPDNKENPYEGNINDIIGQIKEEECNDPFNKNSKIKDPFGGQTIIIEEESIKQNDVSPLSENPEK